MWMTILHFSLSAVALWLISGTLLNFSKHPHWYIRGWDFPRVFVAALASTVAVVHSIWFTHGWWDWLLIGLLVGVVIRNVLLIWPYTMLGRKAVVMAHEPRAERSFRLVISNVLQENDCHDQWSRVIRDADPDVLVAVEIDDKWAGCLDRHFASSHPHRIVQAQDNCYGMAVYSLLPFDGKPDLRFIVQDDIPSIHFTLRLPDGQGVRLHALHPRPPEPLRDQDSAPRDAELVTVGKEIAKKEREVPVVVCGDLNDVAWSFTTQLFLRLSHLLDPRRGRGQYNSFNAKSRLFRFPLDHVFHSNEFELIRLARLPYVGSDHFPMLIELHCVPHQAKQRQGESRPEPGDHEAAAEIVEQAK